MSKRIPELNEIHVLTGGELFEVAVPDVESPTGYTSRKVASSTITGGLPFRHTVDFTYYAPESSESQLAITIPYSDVAPYAMFPGSGDGILAMALMDINVILSMESYDSYPFLVPFNSTILVNRVGKAISKYEYDGEYASDTQEWTTARVGTFHSDNDYEIKPVNNGTFTINNLNFTGIVTPYSVQHQPYGDIELLLSVNSPNIRYTGGYPYKLKGYIDIVAVFTDFPHSSEVDNY